MRVSLRQSRLIRLLPVAVAAPLLVAALSGCVVVPPRHAHGYHDRGGYGRGYDAPPPPAYVWIDGYWDWRGGRRVWIDGHYGPPRRGR